MRTCTEEQREEFIWAIKNGSLQDVTRMIKENIIKPTDQFHGRQPIHFAADYGQLEIIKYLLGHGANVNAKDSHGITPLLYAVWEGHASVVRLLLEKGADRSIIAPNGNKLVDCADKNEIKSLLIS